jgi:hypothetical protein
MVEIEFAFQVVDGASALDPYLDEYEIELMFDNTSRQIAQHIENKLGDLRCDEHGEAPRVTITGEYSNFTEQLEIEYHIDGCCNLFVLEAIQVLNN